MLNGGATSWKRRRQGDVASSTPEAKYVAATSQCGHKVLYLMGMLCDLAVARSAPTAVYEVNNVPCFSMSNKPVRHKYPCHIDIGRYCVREMVQAGVLKLAHTST